MNTTTALIVCNLFLTFSLWSQDPYMAPQDPLAQQKLAHWQDLKFGLLMHWGTYSQWGIVESWSLCNEDEDWCKRRGPYSHDYSLYKQKYAELQTTFDPQHFNPKLWSDAAAEAGMKYVVFTTKHHDGFCMFDTQLTDYKSTSTRCPAQKDFTKEIFEAFRKNDFFIGAYFSKPDWHCPYYWDPYFATPDRNGAFAASCFGRSSCPNSKDSPVRRSHVCAGDWSTRDVRPCIAKSTTVYCLRRDSRFLCAHWEKPPAH
jgi:alpha-L-fucosidase